MGRAVNAVKGKQGKSKKPTVSKQVDEQTQVMAIEKGTLKNHGSVIDEVRSLEEYDDFEEKIRRSNLGSDKSDIDALIVEYIKFMQLRANTTQVSPSFLIDQVWHISLLFPVMYYQLCSLIRNHASDGEGNSVVVEGVDVLMNHFPLLGDNVSKQLNRYNNCVKLYEAEFGMTPPHKYWAGAGSSSQGSSSSNLSPQSVVDMHETVHTKANRSVAPLSQSNHFFHTSVNTASTASPSYIYNKDLNDGESLTIRLRDETGEEISFKMKSTTKMEKLFFSYAQRRGAERDALRFMLDGERISSGQTPERLELRDQDQIDVYLEQGGC